MKALISIFIGLLVTILGVCAQEVRMIEFSVYAQYALQDVEYSPVDESAIAAGASPAENLKIKSHILTRTGPYTFSGLNEITFTNIETQSTVAHVKIPPSSNRWLLIFVKNPHYKNDPSNQLPYLVYPFNENISNLPFNGLVFINFAGSELGIFLGEIRTRIAIGESELVRVDGATPTKIWMQSNDRKRILQAHSKTYNFETGKRNLMILFPPVLRGSSSIDVRLLTDE
ncbi:MAG: hypothetical protein ACI8Z5_000049 [Lentimonas sp.]|jgi:hypothetical protein